MPLLCVCAEPCCNEADTVQSLSTQCIHFVLVANGATSTSVLCCAVFVCRSRNPSTGSGPGMVMQCEQEDQEVVDLVL